MFIKLVVVHGFLLNLGFLYVGSVYLFPLLATLSLLPAIILWPVFIAMFGFAVMIAVCSAIFLTFGKSNINITRE